MMMMNWQERIAVISPHKMINDSLTGENFIAAENSVLTRS